MTPQRKNQLCPNGNHDVLNYSDGEVALIYCFAGSTQRREGRENQLKNALKICILVSQILRGGGRMHSHIKTFSLLELSVFYLH